MPKMIKEVGGGVCEIGNALYIEDTDGNIIIVPDFAVDKLVAAIDVYKENRNEKPD